MSSDAETPCRPGNCQLHEGLLEPNCPIWRGSKDEPEKVFRDGQRKFDDLVKEYLQNALPKFPVRRPIHDHKVIDKKAAYCPYCDTEVGIIERRSLIDLASQGLQQSIQQSAMKGQEVRVYLLYILMF